MIGIAHVPPQLVVDEIDEARQHDADRQQHDDLVPQHAVRQAGMFAQIQQDGDDDTNQAAVERHPAVPHRDKIERVREVIRRVVFADHIVDDKKHASADEHADECVHEKVLDGIFR